MVIIKLVQMLYKSIHFSLLKWSPICFCSRVRLKRLIKGNAVYEKRSAFRRCCWYVKSDVLARFIQEALPVPCQWNYLTSGTHVPREEAPVATGSQGNSPTTPQTSTTPSSSNKTPSSSNKRKSAGSMSITKFMKKAADPEQVGHVW